MATCRIFRFPDQRYFSSSTSLLLPLVLPSFHRSTSTIPQSARFCNSNRELSVFDDGSSIFSIELLPDHARGRCWTLGDPSFPNLCEVRANVSHHQLEKPFGADVSASFVAHIYEKTPKPAADRKVVSLIGEINLMNWIPTDHMAYGIFVEVRVCEYSMDPRYCCPETNHNLFLNNAWD